MAKQTSSEVRARNHYLRRFQAVQNLTSIINNLIRWGCAVLIIRYAHLMVIALAGEQTMADIGIRFFADLRISSALAWLFGGGGALYGLRQRKLRRDTIERLEGRVKKYEKQLDPKRSSSRLTTRGETRKDDT